MNYTQRRQCPLMAMPYGCQENISLFRQDFPAPVGSTEWEESELCWQPA